MKDDAQNKHTADGIQWAVTASSVAWLLAANTVGLLLASLLIWPGLNQWIQPLTYGRWMPLHLDWQLYGWCSLPLLGVLLKHFLGHNAKGSTRTRVCLGLWSIGLTAGGLLWLRGGATGKIFLNWQGLAGNLFVGAQCIIWLYLLVGWFEQLKSRKDLEETILALSSKAIVLVCLIVVPIILLHTSNPEVYPPINPDSGGATGHSLLISTLSLVLIMGLLPGRILNIPRLGMNPSNRIPRYFWSFFLTSIGVYLLIEHGNASHHHLNQILGLGTLLAWPVLTGLLWKRYAWKQATRAWLWVFLAWWSLLALDGWLIFLPGILEIAKFTNILVGHSHLAMGGMVSALNAIILIEMGDHPTVGRILGNRRYLFMWNVACLVYVVSMTLQGWREGSNPAVLFTYDSITQTAYAIRWIAGLGMLSANAWWTGQIAWWVLSQKSPRKTQPEWPPPRDPSPGKVVADHV